MDFVVCLEYAILPAVFTLWLQRIDVTRERKAPPLCDNPLEHLFMEPIGCLRRYTRLITKHFSDQFNNPSLFSFQAMECLVLPQGLRKLLQVNGCHLNTSHLRRTKKILPNSMIKPLPYFRQWDKPNMLFMSLPL